VVTLDDLAQLRSTAAPARHAPAPRPRRAAAPPGGARVASTSGAVVEIPLDCTLAEAERRVILAALRHHGTRARAARALGIGLRTLYTKLSTWSAGAEDAGSA
jgi:DNA-binding NtrC family response regulator